MRRALWRVSMAALLVTTPSFASPAELFGFGPRPQALAGGGTAVARGFEATYANPALLSLSLQRELSVGYQAVRYSLHAEGPRAPGRLSEEGAGGSFIGFVLPVPFGGVLEERVTLGLGTYTPGDLIARARLLYPERLQFPLLTDRAQTLNFNLGVGVDIGHGLRIGVGALALAELVGTVVVRTDSSGRVGTDVDDQLVATYAPIVGAHYQVDQTQLGLAFRGPLEGEFDVIVKVSDLGSLVVPDLSISGVAQYDPLAVQAEIAHTFDDLTLVAGATYEHWSAFEGWQRATVECPESQPDCDALVPEPVGFSSTIVPRVGALYALTPSASAKAELRAGYAFEPTPAPEQTGASNYLDSDRHIFSVGYGIELAEPLPPIRVDAFYQLHWLAERKHEKDSDVAADNPGAPEVTSKGTVQNLGVLLGVKF